jgi:hypothetical protein
MLCYSSDLPLLQLPKFSVFFCEHRRLDALRGQSFQICAKRNMTDPLALLQIKIRIDFLTMLFLTDN